MKETVLEAPDISCEHCIMTIEKAVTKLPGVRFISGDPVTKRVTLDFDPATTNLDTIRAAMEEEGYPATES